VQGPKFKLQYCQNKKKERKKERRKQSFRIEDLPKSTQQEAGIKACIFLLYQTTNKQSPVTTINNKKPITHLQ
jgi:hypothetical protein